MPSFASICQRGAFAAAFVGALLVAVPASAQIKTIDPNSAINGTPSSTTPQSYPSGTSTTAGQPSDRYGAPSPRYGGQTPSQPGELPPRTGSATGTPVPPPPARPSSSPAGTFAAANPATAGSNLSADQQAHGTATTYGRDDLIGAADGLFGKGAKGLAKLIQKILSDHGEPNAYISGRVAGGAFVFGLRYGSGTLYHKVEGDMPIYWTGPSIGFDAGADAGKVFILVYNLYDTEKLYQRFPAGQGSAYFIGGFNAGYIRKGRIVLIPITVGAGLRLGVSAGYIKFSHHQKWFPF